MLLEPEIRRFLQHQYPRVVAAVALVSGSRAAAEDAVQEALLRAWERVERGDEIGSLPNWVATVALNLSRSGIRRAIAERRARRQIVPASAGTLAEPSGDPVDVQVRWRACRGDSAKSPSFATCSTWIPERRRWRLG